MNPIEFSRNLFALRMERKLTIEDLAEALGVTPEIICEWECAKTSPSLDQMNKLSKLYGIPLDEIIRNPKPRESIPVTTEPPAAEQPAEEPAAEETVPESLPEEAPSPRRGTKKKRVPLWEIGIIVLLLAIIALALLYLIKPDLLPTPNFAQGIAAPLPTLHVNLL